MIRGFDIIVVLIFAAIASAIIITLFTVTLPWYIPFLLGGVLSIMHDIWKLYERFRINYEEVKRRNN